MCTQGEPHEGGVGPSQPPCWLANDSQKLAETPETDPFLEPFERAQEHLGLDLLASRTVRQSILAAGGAQLADFGGGCLRK